MVDLRALFGGSVVALVAAGVAVAPAFGAPELGQRNLKRIVAPSRASGGFTPAAADPRLAAVFARAGLDDRDFRFTPSETRSGNRAVTVAVRARTGRGSGLVAPPAAVATVGIAPIAYNLGVSVGWKRFAVTGDVAKVDLGAQPGGRERADVGVSYSLPRFTASVKGAADRALPGAPKLVDTDRSYSLDVGGSYSLTRNIDLTAGMRYKSDRERLARVADDRRDSQAVYVGTAFRF